MPLNLFRERELIYPKRLFPSIMKYQIKLSAPTQKNGFEFQAFLSFIHSFPQHFYSKPKRIQKIFFLLVFWKIFKIPTKSLNRIIVTEIQPEGLAALALAVAVAVPVAKAVSSRSYQNHLLARK